MSNVSLAKEIVTNGEKHFFVSTINRDCSSMMGGRYAETMVWEWLPDREGDKRGELVAQDEASEDSLYGHLRMVEKFKGEAK